MTEKSTAAGGEDVMMTSFAEHLVVARNNITNARRGYIRERRWTAEQWYLAWQETDLPREVESAIAGTSAARERLKKR